MFTTLGNLAFFSVRIYEGGCHDDLCFVVKSALHRINVPNDYRNISSKVARFLDNIPPDTTRTFSSRLSQYRAHNQSLPQHSFRNSRRLRSAVLSGPTLLREVDDDAIHANVLNDISLGLDRGSFRQTLSHNHS